MFTIEKLCKRGWWNTTMVIVATSRMQHEEKRLRFSGLHVARVDDWHIVIEKGERFTIALPASVGAKVGDKLSLDAVMRHRPVKSRWVKTQSF